MPFCFLSKLYKAAERQLHKLKRFMFRSKTYYFDCNSGQYLFDRCLNAIFFVFKLLFKAIIYFPLLVTGYLLTTRILQKQDHALVWIGVTLLFTFIFYAIVFFLKGILIAFKGRGNLLWILVFIVCVAYTCVAPLWIMFDTIEKLMFEISMEQGTTLTWLFSFVLGSYIYSRYQFLMNVAPVSVAPFYQAGINLVASSKK